MAGDHAGSDEVKFPATAWQQLAFGVFAWEKHRVQNATVFSKRSPVGESCRILKAPCDSSRDLARISKLSRWFCGFPIAATTLEDALNCLLQPRAFWQDPDLSWSACNIQTSMIESEKGAACGLTRDRLRAPISCPAMDETDVRPAAYLSRTSDEHHTQTKLRPMVEACSLPTRPVSRCHSDVNFPTHLRGRRMR